MLGSGVFVLPYLVANVTGASAWLAYLLAGLTILPAAASKMELTTAMPSSGGTYVYLDRTFGPLVGTISGLGLWMSMILKSSFAIIGFGAYLSLLTDINIIYISSLSLVAITFLNIRGISKTSFLINIITFLSLASLLSLVIYGFALAETTITPPLETFTNGLSGLFNSAALVIISYAGITKVAALAEEVKSPEKNLPKGIFISLLLVTFLYCSITYLVTHWIPADYFTQGLTPIYDLSLAVATHATSFENSQNIAYAFAALAILTMVGMANAGLLAASRFPYAMSRDNLLPKMFSTIHSKYLTPTASISISALVMGFCIYFLDVEKVVKVASCFILSVYIAECLSIIILREGRVQWYRPSYKCPFYPFLPLIGLVSGSLLLAQMGMIVFSSFLFLSIPGLLIYFFYSRKKTERRGVIGFRGFRRDLKASKEAENSLSESKHYNDPNKEQYETVVALSDSFSSAEIITEIGTNLEKNCKTHVVWITELPEHVSSQSTFFPHPKVRSVERRLEALAEERNKVVKFDNVYSHDVNKSLFNITDTENSLWLLEEWKEKSSESFTIYNPIQFSLKKHLNCHYAVFKNVGIRYFKKILVFDYGFNRDLILKPAQNLAESYKATLALATLLPNQSTNSVQQEVRSSLHLTAQTLGAQECIFWEEQNYDSQLIEESARFDLLLLPTKKESLWNVLLGKGQHKIISEIACSTLLIHS